MSDLELLAYLCIPPICIAALIFILSAFREGVRASRQSQGWTPPPPKNSFFHRSYPDAPVWVNGQMCAYKAVYYSERDGIRSIANQQLWVNGYIRADEIPNEYNEPHGIHTFRRWQDAKNYCRWNDWQRVYLVGMGGEVVECESGFRAEEAWIIEDVT